MEKDPSPEPSNADLPSPDLTSGDLPEDDAGLSLEELSQSYADVLGQGRFPYDSESAPVEMETADEARPLQVFDPLEEELAAEDACPVTPMSILEAILFVGRNDNKPIAASDVASLMRGVREEEVESLVAELNESYTQTQRAVRIGLAAGGFRLELAPELGSIRERFYGRARDVKLNQAAIDCLALVAYQPGISREKIEEQRGQPCGGVLNQLVRRELLEMRRVGSGKAMQASYFPTPRMLELAGLESIDDLPQADDWEG